MSQPYAAPITTICSSNTSPNTITINITPYTAFTATNYNLRTYTNNVLTSTSSAAYSPTQIVVNDLSYLNVYTFQVQLFNSTDSSEFSIKNENIPVYPVGPTITSRSNVKSTTVQVNYTTVFDLSGAACIINVPGISYTNLTTTSVILTNLTQNTPYNNLTILFRKTINGFVISSSPSTVPSFTTDQITGPTNLAQSSSDNTTITLTFTQNDSLPGSVTLVRVFYSTGEFGRGGPGTVTLVNQGTVQISSLFAGQIYNSVYITVSDGSYTSTPSNTLASITTVPAPAPIVSTPVTPGGNSVFITYAPYNAFPLAVDGGIFYDSSGTSQGTVSSNLFSRQLTVSGLSPYTTYTNSYIKLTQGNNTSAPSNTFTFTPLEIPVLISYSVSFNSYNGDFSNQVYISYNSFTSFAPTGAGSILYTDQGQFYGIDPVNQPEYAVIFYGLTNVGATYTNCYIILGNGTRLSAHSVGTYTGATFSLFASDGYVDNYL